MQSSGVVLDTRSYTTLMEAYGKASMCDKAEKLFKQMEAVGFIPDIVTNCVLVKAFAKAQRYQEGLKYYVYVVQHSEPFHEPSQILISQHYAAYGNQERYPEQ
jgi:pentatricopeptide repeat protein